MILFYKSNGQTFAKLWGPYIICSKRSILVKLDWFELLSMLVFDAEGTKRLEQAIKRAFGSVASDDEDHDVKSESRLETFLLSLPGVTDDQKAAIRTTTRVIAHAHTSMLFEPIVGGPEFDDFIRDAYLPIFTAVQEQTASKNELKPDHEGDEPAHRIKSARILERDHPARSKAPRRQLASKKVDALPIIKPDQKVVVEGVRVPGGARKLAGRDWTFSVRPHDGAWIFEYQRADDNHTIIIMNEERRNDTFETTLAGEYVEKEQVKFIINGNFVDGELRMDAIDAPEFFIIAKLR